MNRLKKRLFSAPRLLASAISLLGFSLPAWAQVQPVCPADAFSTHRVLSLPSQSAAYGVLNYGPLPLKADELVLTFDDGPRPGSTERILAILASHCAHATFYLVGRELRAYPAIAQAAQRAGHSTGLHSDTHPNFAEIAPGLQRDEFQKVQQAHRDILGEAAASWRYPYLVESAYMKQVLSAQAITVMSADVGADDWLPNQSPQMLTQRLLERLAEHRQKSQSGALVLLHDVQDQTAEALPMMLKALKAAGWKLVHLRWAD